MIKEASKTAGVLSEYLEEGDVVFFGYKGAPPDFLIEKKIGRVRFFIKEKKIFTDDPKDFYIASYVDISEIRDQYADVYFLDKEATRVLLTGFPISAQYLLVRLTPHFSWGIAFLGLVRRVWLNHVSFEGVRKIKSDGKNQSWLVLKHNLKENLSHCLSLDESIGVPNFFRYLRDKKVNYVVLRFFERLPELYRKGGDLDLLVKDEDEPIVRGFLLQHRGSTPIHVFTPNKTVSNDITYYPPPIAQRIIKSGVAGPANSRIPSPKEAFLSFAYHVLYHKGLLAGVPTKTLLKVNASPDNDYTKELKRLADLCGVTIEPMTMENISNILEKEGWQPKLDTLAKISERNTWVRKYFFSNQSKKKNEMGLGVFILKKRAFIHGVAEAILKDIESNGRFSVLFIKKFSQQDIQRVTEHLRGGVWSNEVEMGDGLSPAMVIVVLDTHVARLSKFIKSRRVHPGGIKDLKKVLRAKFDTTKESSMIHSTDNTNEANEYLRWCFSPDEVACIQDKLNHEYGRLQVSVVEKFQYLVKSSILFFPDQVRHLKERIVKYLIQ